MKTLIEHVFVTQRDWEEVAAAADSLFAQFDMMLTRACLKCGADGRGRSLASFEPTCAECQLPRMATFSNGAPLSGTHTSVTSLPSWISLEFDHGRIEMAAVLRHPSKADKQHRAVLSFFANSTEAVLARGTSIPEIKKRWQNLCNQCETQALERRGRVTQLALKIAAAAVGLMAIAAIYLFLT